MSPYPWTFRGNGLRDANDRVILLTVPAVGLTVAEDDANRRAIEAAPELLDHLLRVTAALRIALANYASKDSENHGRLLALRLEAEAFAARVMEGGQ